MKKLILISCLLLIAGRIIHAQQTDLPKLTGPHLGQQPPGIVPSSAALEYGMAFTPDGREFYFNRGGMGVMVCTRGAA